MPRVPPERESNLNAAEVVHGVETSSRRFRSLLPAVLSAIIFAIVLIGGQSDELSLVAGIVLSCVTVASAGYWVRAYRARLRLTPVGVEWWVEGPWREERRVLFDAIERVYFDTYSGTLHLITRDGELRVPAACVPATRAEQRQLVEAFANFVDTHIDGVGCYWR